MSTEAAAIQPPPTPGQVPLVNRQLALAWMMTALFWGVVTPVFGILAAMKLDDPEFLRNIEWLQFARLRIAHVNGVIFGFFTAACFGFMNYAIPKLCGRPLTNMRMAWWGYGFFNVAVLAGEACLLLGYIQPVEAGEYPLPVDLIATIGIVLTVGVYLHTIVKREHARMYVSLWYFVGGIVWSLINLPLGTFIVPQMKGVTSAAMHGFYLHNVVGLWITPLGLGAAYYMMPATARAKLFSHKLSLIGFWGLAFFYPLNGVHHYIYSPIADWAQTIAITASWMLLLPVGAFVLNMFGTMFGEWKQFAGRNYTLKFTVLGTVWYLATCIQGPTEAFRDMQALTHFGDYNVGHAHSAVYGAFAIWMMAAIYFVLPRVTGRKVWSHKLMAWHWWLQILGFGIMFAALTISGLAQGAMLQTDNTRWIDTVKEIRPYWIMRTLGGTMMDVGIAFFFYNMIMTIACGKRVPYDSHESVTMPELGDSGADE